MKVGLFFFPLVNCVLFLQTHCYLLVSAAMQSPVEGLHVLSKVSISWLLR
jgi:hypothetical protein